MANTDSALSVPVQIFHRVTTTDPGTGQAQDNYTLWGTILAGVTVRPISEMDAAGKVRTGRSYLLTCWRVPAMAQISTRDRVRIFLAEGPVDADIAAIAPASFDSLVMEARAYDAS